ncbi:hypothetical protein MTYP_02436 [Methylophilaceae bacterium]|nr:hypothetical protein MTYP_02436 [Methylophilaceae bacterium]
MLNKQGIFNRRTSPSESQAPVLNSISQLNTQAKTVSPPLMPGHQAAIESATSVNSHASVASSQNEQKAAVKPETMSGNRLIVGPDVKLKGAEIQDCDMLVVEGRVEATMDSRVIQIAQNGAFSGKVGIDVAEIYGNFDGELTARSQLIIHSSGRVSGKIRYGKILIEEGGELSGDIGAISDDKSILGKVRVSDKSLV